MAALYLHNAIFTPDTPHSRTLSSGTVATVSLSSSTHNSHPTEPLLSSSAYHDLLSRQPGRNTDGQQWDMSLSFDGGSDSPIERERRGYWEQSLRHRLKVLKATKVTLEIIVGVWALYNTIRYFLAFTMYASVTGQQTALALGTSTAVSVALLACAAIVSVLQPYLIVKNTPIRYLFGIRTIFRLLGSFFLFSPAVVNLALTITWRHTSDTELASNFRCLDVDIIWSISTSKCSSSTWGAWLVLSIFRVLMTGIILALPVIASFYSHTRHPSQSSSHCRQHGRQKLHRPSSGLTTSTSPPMSFTSLNPGRPVSIALPSPGPLNHQSSRSSVTSNTQGGNTSRLVGFSREPSSSHASQNANRISRDSSSSLNDNANMRHSNSSLEGGSSEESFSEARFDPAAIQQRLSEALSPNQAHGMTYFPPSSSSSLLRGQTPIQTPIQASDRDLHDFVDRFRMLVTQLQRETEEALEYAMEGAEDDTDGDDEDEDEEPDRYTALPTRRRDRAGSSTPTQSRNSYTQHLQQASGSNPQSPSLYSASPMTPSFSSSPPSAYPSSLYNSSHYSTYKEFGFPYGIYPPDDQVRILNGYVRRMPTIESISSKEFPDLGSVSPDASIAGGNGSRKGSVSERSGESGRSGKSGQSATSLVSTSSHERLVVGNAGTAIGNVGRQSPTIATAMSGNAAVTGRGPVTGTPMALKLDTQSLRSVGGSLGSAGSGRSLGTFGAVLRHTDRDIELESPSTDYGSVYSYGSYGGSGAGGFQSASLSAASLMSASERGLGSEPSSRRNSVSANSIATSSVSGKGKGLFGGTTTATEAVLDVEEMSELIERIGKETQAQLQAQAQAQSMSATQGPGHGSETSGGTKASVNSPHGSPVSSKSSKTAGSKASFYTVGSSQSGVMLTPNSELLPPTPEHEEV